jgi:ATP-binding cassette subfamily B multidrug efflux pump
MGKRENKSSKAFQGGVDRERFVYQDDDVMEKPFDWQQMRRLSTYFKPYVKQLIPVSFMVFIGILAKLSIPLLIAYVIDYVLLGDQGLGVLTVYAGVMLAIYAVQWVTTMLRIRITNTIGQHVIFDIRSDLFKHIQRLSFRFFDKRPAGSVLVRVTNDVNSLQELFTNGVVNLLIDLIELLGIIIILFFLSWKLALAVIITVPIMFILSTAVRKRIRRAWQDVRMKQSRINAHLNESIQGIKVTQAYTQEKENMKYFKDMNTVNLKSWDVASGLNQAFGPLTEITAGLGMFILFYYGGFLAQSGALTIGVLVAFANFIGRFWEPINRLGQMYSQLLIAMASGERIFEFIDEDLTVKEKENARSMPPIQGHVMLEELSFAYEADRPALKDITLQARPGQSVALVGHTGSGKSTIMNMLCRFYDPTAGRVLIDGINLKDVTLESLRNQIGIVMQDTFIFSGTIRDNIRYGRPDATNAEVEQAAKTVHADEFIQKLPQGYQTEVEERGNALSMGQRQLISFARALLANPKILILDEATASIDTETEQRIQKALHTLLKGRTSFIVAHRLSTIRHADQIIVLDHGEIVEIGNHESLMRGGGYYSELIEAQYRFLNEVV